MAGNSAATGDDRVGNPHGGFVGGAGLVDRQDEVDLAIEQVERRLRRPDDHPHTEPGRHRRAHPEELAVGGRSQFGGGGTEDDVVHETRTHRQHGGTDLCEVGRVAHGPHDELNRPQCAGLLCVVHDGRILPPVG